MNTSNPTYIESHISDYNDYLREIKINSIKIKQINQLSSLSLSEEEKEDAIIQIDYLTETIFCIKESILYLSNNTETELSIKNRKKKYVKYFDISNFVTLICILNNLQCNIQNINITEVDSRIKKIMKEYINNLYSLNLPPKKGKSISFKEKKNIRIFDNESENISENMSEIKSDFYKESFIIKISMYILKKKLINLKKVIKFLKLSYNFETEIKECEFNLNIISILYQKYITHQESHNEFSNNYEELSNKFYNEFKKNNEFNKFINKYRKHDSLNNYDSLNLSFLKLLNKTENESAFERSNWNRSGYLQNMAMVDPPKPKIPVANPSLSKTVGKYGLSASSYNIGPQNPNRKVGNSSPNETAEQNSSKSISVFPNDTVNTKKFTDDLEEIGMNKKFTKNEYNKLPDFKKMIFTVISDIEYLKELYQNIKNSDYNLNNINVSEYILKYNNFLKVINKQTINNKEKIVEIITKIALLFESINLIISYKSTGRSTTKIINKLNKDIKYIL